MEKPVKAAYKLFQKSEEQIRQKEIQEIIRARIEQKTKKRTTKTQLPAESINKFAAVAGHFFFPLINGFGRNQFVLQSRTVLKNDLENQLLLTFLQTLSIIMISAVHCPQVAKFATEIIKISQCLRFSVHAKIRLGVLHMLATVFMSVPIGILNVHFYHDIMELKTWLEEIVSPNFLKREKNDECLKVAENLLGMCDTVLTSSE